MTSQLGNILDDAQDIAVVAHSQQDIYIFAAKPSPAFQKQAFDLSISHPEDANVEEFNHHWKIKDKKGISGSSTYLDLRFDKRALRPNGLWIPSFLEAKALESQGKLENGVYRDYGIVVINENDPNTQLAQPLVAQAAELRLELPLVVPFRALDYTTRDSRIATVSFVEEPKGILSGQEAADQISRLTYKRNSGVHRLYRYYDGDWDADWNYLDDSGADGRVDWMCGEATRENLIEAYNSLSGRKYGQQIEKLHEAQKTEQESFVRSLE